LATPASSVRWVGTTSTNPWLVWRLPPMAPATGRWRGTAPLHLRRCHIWWLRRDASQCGRSWNVSAGGLSGERNERGAKDRLEFGHAGSDPARRSTKSLRPHRSPWPGCRPTKQLTPIE
jgi:hypothetical protein